jgi:hypothetical protein
MDGVDGESRFVKLWTLIMPYVKLGFAKFIGLTMGYKFSWKYFLSYFSPHFLLFGHEFELPSLI